MSVCEISIINSLICQKLGSVGTVQQKIKLFSLFINLESFSKSTFVFFFFFFLYVCFYQSFLIKFNNPSFNACFKFPMSITYFLFLLSYKLATMFSTFPVFILSSKNGKSYEVHAVLLDANINLQKIFCIIIFTIFFYEIFIKFRSIYIPLKSSADNFCIITYSYKLFIS